MPSSFGRTIFDWLSTTTERRDRGTSILDLSELTRVPGNIGLSERHKLARVREIFRPYHDRIATELDRASSATDFCVGAIPSWDDHDSSALVSLLSFLVRRVEDKIVDAGLGEVATIALPALSPLFTSQYFPVSCAAVATLPS